MPTGTVSPISVVINKIITQRNKFKIIMELTVPYFCPLFNDSPPIANTGKNKI